MRKKGIVQKDSMIWYDSMTDEEKKKFLGVIAVTVIDRAAAGSMSSKTLSISSRHMVSASGGCGHWGDAAPAGLDCHNSVKREAYPGKGGM